MRKQLLRSGIASSAMLTILALSSGGMAGAASISITGPGSTNIITTSSRSGGTGSSISTTGPGSTNVIRTTAVSNKFTNHNCNNSCHTNWMWQKRCNCGKCTWQKVTWQQWHDWNNRQVTWQNRDW